MALAKALTRFPRAEPISRTASETAANAGTRSRNRIW
jgi:hypothetical protein